MLLVKPSYEILTDIDGPSILRRIEAAGRTCYKSEDQITDESAKEFCSKILKRGHLSVVEHVSISVRFVANRGFTHELVRHRLASFSQESSRYCDYSGGVSFVIPPWVNMYPGEYNYQTVPARLSEEESSWAKHMAVCEAQYIALTTEGNWYPQQARGVLPIDLKTEIVMTANVREWRHVFSLRCSKAAHPAMQQLMVPLRKELLGQVPVLFDAV